MSSIATKTARNISYVGISQMASLLSSLGVVIVLARILTPEDFGIVGLGMVFLNLFYGLQNFGILPAVIQRDGQIDECISVGLSLRWIIAAVLAAVTVVVSPVLSDLFGNPAVTLVLIVYTLNLFILPFGFPAQTLLTRRLAFPSLAVAGIAQSAATAILTIGLALCGFGYWSLVFGSIAGSVTFVLALFHSERRIFRPKMNLRLMRELLGFGRHLLVTGFMAFIIFNVDQLAIAGVISVASLGAYVVAVKFGRTLGRQIAEAVNQVLFPTMARMKHDLNRLKTGYIQSLRMISIVSVPVSLGMSSMSPLFVDVVLGEAWAAAAVPIAILSFQGLLSSLIPPAANVLMSIGKLSYMSVVGVVHALAILVFAYPVASVFGIEGVCWLTTGLSLGVFIYYCVVFAHIFGTRVREIVSPLFAPLLSGSIMLALLYFPVQSIPSTLISLVGFVIVGFLVYVFSLHIVSGGRDVRDFLTLLRGVLRRR